MTNKQVDELLLIHGRTGYDAAARREYYLRTRKLKGRRPGMGPDPKGGSEGGTVTPIRKNVAKKPATAGQGAQAAAHARLEALKKKIEHLKDVLQKLVEQTKAKSGVEDPKSKSKQDSSSDSKSDGGPKEKLTGKQKREAAERSEKYRKEHKNDAPTKDVKALKQDIVELRQKIQKIRDQLENSDKKARPKSNSTSTAAAKGR